MKRRLSIIGITCTVFMSLFLFEITPAQMQDIDFSVDSCRCEKIPGRDSVLVTAYIEYKVAEPNTPQLNLSIAVFYDQDKVLGDYIPIPEFEDADCLGEFFPCVGLECPELEGLGDGTCRGGEVQPCYCSYLMIRHWRLEEPSGTEVMIIVDALFAIPEWDETNNECSTTYVPPTIPTLTEWGMIIFGVVLLVFITWVFLRRRQVIGDR